MVVVSGDVDPAAAIRGVKKAFGTWKVLAPTPPKITLSAVPDLAPGTGLTRIPSPGGAELVVGFPGLAHGDADWPAAALAVAALGGPASARLRWALSSNAKLATWSDAELDAGGYAGPVIVRAGVTPENADAALAAIRETLRALSTDGPSRDESTAARAWLLGRLARRLETNPSITAAFADGEREGDSGDGPRASAARLNAASHDEITRAAKTLFLPDAPAVLAAPAAPKK